MSTNEALSQCLRRMSRVMELLGEDSFKSSAHARAARAIEGLPFDIASIAEDRAKLLEIEGIGAKLADKIQEFCRTGRIREADDLVAQVPPGVLALLEIPGLGPKTVATLWRQGGITDTASLKKAMDDGSILKLPRMGAKTVENIRANLAFAEQSGERMPLGLALPLAERIVEHLLRVRGVSRATHAGSLRRGKETIGDIDILVAAADAGPVSAAFASMPGVEAVLVSGETKSSVRMRAGADLGRWGSAGDAGPAGSGPSIQVDLRVLPESSWGAALMYFTGSKEHNIRMRERAVKRGFTLNDWGLFPLDEEKTAPHLRGVKPVAGATEEGIYAALGLPYLPPEIREDRGELDLRKTPRLLDPGDIKAELHAHTTASDGAMSIEDLARRAKERGFHTIAVTDHSRSSAVAGGLSADRLLEHVEAVRKADERIAGITILAGSEVDILADGTLDYEDKILAQLDVVVASPHAGLSQDPETATRRLIRAVRNPHVRILGHPTGRLINRRPGLSPDLPRLIEAARERGVALEINAHWLRLDLRDTHVRAAIEGGCLVAVDCDVHDPGDFDNLRYGVTTARRGWATPERCVNTWSAAKLREWLSHGRPRSAARARGA